MHFHEKIAIYPHISQIAQEPAVLFSSPLAFYPTAPCFFFSSRRNILQTDTVQGLIFSIASISLLYSHLAYILFFSFIKIEALPLSYQRPKPQTLLSCIFSFWIFFARGTLNISQYLNFEYAKAGPSLCFLSLLPK